MADALEQPERFVKLPEVCRRVGLGKSMIYEMIREGRFPAPYKLSPFASRWSEREIVDRKSTRLNSVTNAHLVCRLLLEKKKRDKHKRTSLVTRSHVKNDNNTYAT